MGFDYRKLPGKYLAIATEFVTAPNPFLTYKPNNQKVTKTTQHCLYHIAAAAYTEVRLKYQITYQDGTQSSVYMLTYVGTVLQYDINIYPAGYTQLGIAAHDTDAANPATKYDVWLTNDSNVAISTVRTFVLKNAGLWDRQFLFNNSLGGVDTLLATGDQGTALDTEQLTAEVFLPHDYNVKDGDTLDYYSNTHEQFSGQSGFMSKEEARYYALELANVQKMYLLDTVREKLLPIIINKKDVSLYKDSDTVFFVQFSYKFAFDTNFYTPE
jgi:hypothetical protein